jgi:hypothetical protein
MASRKLTQLPTATEVTASDKIYIVDVSDTSESPQGTSKQAVISNLPSSGITTLTSTDGSIDIDLTDPSAPDLSIGVVVSYFTVTNLNENGNGIVTAISNRIGGTISFVNTAAFSYTLTRTGGAALTGTVKAYLSQLVNDSGDSVVSCVGNGIGFGETFDLLNFDGDALSSVSIIKDALLTIIYIP